LGAVVSEQGVFVGIDVSKKPLEVGLPPEGKGFKVDNRQEGWGQLAERPRERNPLWWSWRPQAVNKPQ
jgi:hypothetical protein